MAISRESILHIYLSSSYANGCNGAAPHKYPEWFAADGGVSPHEATYQYLGGSPRLNCNTASSVAKWNSGARVTGSTYDYSCGLSKLTQLVYEKGAVLVGVYASDSSFSGYNGQGVYDACTSVRALIKHLNNKPQSGTPFTPFSRPTRTMLSLLSAMVLKMALTTGW